jgi:16S rRNA (guanine527-N7)-methyltransferase
VKRRPPTQAAGPRAARSEAKPSGDHQSRLAAARARLVDGFAELALPASPEQIEALLRLAALLERWGQRINLSGHRDVESIVARLVLDAAALSLHLPAAPSLVDLGSGAGVPGLPIAVLRPECALLLVEAREKRHHFQRAAVRELGLRNVEMLLGRAERLGAQPRSAVIAQALAEPSKALGWMLPWAEIGGWLVIPGGERPPEIASRPELSPSRAVAYSVPGGGAQRTLWMARRLL